MRKSIVGTMILAVFALSYWGQRSFDHSTDIASQSPDAGYRRIISLAPSVTEILFALGLGDRVQGVTQYCLYPPEAQEKPRIGAHFDTNYEAILSLEPDLIVLLPVSTDARERFAELGLRTREVDHRTLKGILDSIAVIGKDCEVPDRSDALLEEIHARIEKVRRRVAGLERPTVLVSAGRTKGTDKLDEVYAAGRGQWYDDVIEMAGGRNALVEEGIPFPSLTGEGLVRLDPDVIVEMAQVNEERGITAESIVGDWDVLPELGAVREGRIHVLSGDHTTIPGPRFVQIVEELARVLHPDVDWDAS
jgi:iron complex transport system substrate-binding protein